jgi:RHH-type rel operon transcriptional repressor/antitoxin RelB
MLALRLPPDLEKRLDDLAKRTGRTKSFYARLAIVEYIDDLEDLALAERALREDDGTRYTLAEILAEPGNRDKSAKTAAE